MGHIGRLKEQYRDLAGRLRSGQVAFAEPQEPAAWEGWREILEILYTPEEALLASQLPARPIALRKLAIRLGVPEAELGPRLDAMCDKGVVMDLVHPRTGQRSYLLSPPVVGFFEYSLMRAKDAIPKKRMAEALHAYTHGDPAFAREAFGHDTVMGRALVHEPGLGDEALPDVLAWERASDVVSGARRWAVSLCFCRHKAQHLGEACDARTERRLAHGRHPARLVADVVPVLLELPAPDAAEVEVRGAVVVAERGRVDRVGARHRLRLRDERSGGPVGPRHPDEEAPVGGLGGEVEVVRAVALRGVRRPDQEKIEHEPVVDLP